MKFTDLPKKTLDANLYQVHYFQEENNSHKNVKEGLTTSLYFIGDRTDTMSAGFWNNLIVIGGIVNAVISIGVQLNPFDPNTQVVTVYILFFTRQSLSSLLVSFFYRLTSHPLEFRKKTF